MNGYTKEHKIIIWGTGRKFHLLEKYINFEEVVCCFEREKQFRRSEDEYKYITSPDELRDIQFDFLLISSEKNFSNISHECIFQYGIEINKIMSLEAYLCARNDRINNQMLMNYQKIISNLEMDRANTMKIDYGLSRENVLVKGNIISGGYHYFIDEKKDTVGMYVVTHKEFRRVNNEGYIYIGVGTFDSKHSNDNVGDNISNLNSKINECTALYWIWKNEHKDIVGLNHYRRLFESEINEGWPIQTVEAKMLLEHYDIVLARRLVLERTIVEQMKKEICKEAFESSWMVIQDIFKKRGNYEQQTFMDFCNNRILFPCNMFVMRRERLNSYCEWLFPILFEMIERINISECWDDYSKRVIGFWAERLLTVWVLLSNVTIKELPILLLE